jgi:hypothetical protein
MIRRLATAQWEVVASTRVTLKYLALSPTQCITGTTVILEVLNIQNFGMLCNTAETGASCAVMARTVRRNSTCTGSVVEAVCVSSLPMASWTSLALTVRSAPAELATLLAERCWLNAVG